MLQHTTGQPENSGSYGTNMRSIFISYTPDEILITSYSHGRVIPAAYRIL